MTTQPEALRLANSLAAHSLSRHGQTQAAAELRRLLAVETQRDALLEALKGLVRNEGLDAYSHLDKGIGTATAAGQRWLNARAAIKAVEETK